MGLQANATPAWWDYVMKNDDLLQDTPPALQDVMNFLELIGREGLFKKILRAGAGWFD